MRKCLKNTKVIVYGNLCTIIDTHFDSRNEIMINYGRNFTGNEIAIKVKREEVKFID